jgi:lipopolysaccharide biosynthesis protein
MPKTLVLYVFHQYNHRVKHFIENAIFFDKNTDFVIICNDIDLEFEVPGYVRVIKRENVGYDFGGWSDALLKNNLYKGYDSFIFVNSSVMGPYTVSYYQGKWTDIYLNGLKGNIKLFGTTINTCGNPLSLSHVQSYIFAMDSTTLEFLINSEIFSMTNYAKTYDEAILNKEILMSQKLIHNGWNIGSLLQLYKDVDFTFKSKKPENYKIHFLSDVMYPIYMGKLWFKEELIFVKGNRIQEL